MAKYELLKDGSNVKPKDIYTDINFIDIHYNIKKVKKKDEQTETTYTHYSYDTLRVRDGEPDKNEMIQFFIHTEYSIDDEIALINNKEDKAEEYEAYNTRRIELKDLATELYTLYTDSLVK